MATAAKKKGLSSLKKSQLIKARKPCPRQEMEVDIGFDSRAAEAGVHGAGSPPLPEALAHHVSPDVLNRLWMIIESRRTADLEISHSARLLARGTPRVAQKLGEEATECLIELMAGNRPGVINESADLLYHLLVAWVSAGIRPEIWHVLQQRERVSHVTEGTDVPLASRRRSGANHKDPLGMPS